jgi:hypothetical protein
VTQQDLDGAQIDARFQQMGGEAMPEQMHAAALADAGPGLGRLKISRAVFSAIGSLPLRPGKSAMYGPRTKVLLRLVISISLRW